MKQDSSFDVNPDLKVDLVHTRLSDFPHYPKRPFLSFWAFMAFVVVRYIQLGARRDILATIRFEFLVGIIVIVLVSIQLSERKPEIGQSRNIIVMMCLLFVAMVLEIPFAAAPIIARQTFMDHVIKFAFLTFFMTVMIESPRSMRIFLVIFLFSLFYITLEATEGQVSGGLVWENQGIMRLHGAVPIYQHPNSLAGAAMGALPYIAFLFVHTKQWWLRLGFLASVATDMVCVVYSGSRTAYVGMIALILWWWFQSQRKWRFLIWLLVAGSIFVSVVPDQYVGRFESITGNEKEGHSRVARIQILRDAVAIFLENPLGVGVASFPVVRMARFGRFQDTHNLYLEVATNLGVQGLLIFLGLVGVTMGSLRNSMIQFKLQMVQLARARRGTRFPRHIRAGFRTHYRDLEYLIGATKATGGFVLIRLVLGLFGMDLYEVYWWFAGGMAITLAGLVVHTRRNTRFLIELAQKQASLTQQ